MSEVIEVGRPYAVLVWVPPPLACLLSTWWTSSLRLAPSPAFILNTNEHVRGDRGRTTLCSARVGSSAIGVLIVDMVDKLSALGALTRLHIEHERACQR